MILAAVRRAGCLVLLAALWSSPGRADNFLIVVADDIGVDKVGAYEAGECVMGQCPSPPPTPTIDALAARGVLFRNAWAMPVCSSTRVATLTGQHGFRTGVGRFVFDDTQELGLNESLSRLPRFYEKAGKSGRRIFCRYSLPSFAGHR